MSTSVEGHRAGRESVGEALQFGGIVHPGQRTGATGPGSDASVSSQARMSSKPFHATYGTPSRSQWATRLELREGHVGVERAVPIGLSLADERDEAARALGVEHGLHLARAAPDAFAGDR